MDLSFASIVALAAALLGFNFLGLFFAAYLFDRSAKHILWYIGSGIFIVLAGLIVVVAMSGPDFTYLFNWVEIAIAASLGMASYGLSRAYGVAFPKKTLAVLSVYGAALIVLFHDVAPPDMQREVLVSIWHAASACVVCWIIYRSPKSKVARGMLLSFAAILAQQYLWHPGFAWYAISVPNISGVERLNLYMGYVNVGFSVAIFGFAAGLFFQVMTDFANGFRRASVTDMLSGLLNRRGFMEAIDSSNATHSSIIMIDIDHFKAINDTFGHAQGDKVIAEVAAILLRDIDNPHICGRLGGEEFGIFLKGVELPFAIGLAQALRVAIETELANILPKSHTITASFGVAVMYGDQLSTALRDADRALYVAKAEGRNRVCVAQTDKKESLLHVA